MPRNKRCKLQQQNSTTSSPTAANENNNTSPSQGLQPVCDKSLDFTNLQTLPDFSSFQKPVTDMGNSCDVTVREDNGFGNIGTEDVPSTPKVAIPRLTAKQSPVPSPRRGKNTKYKAIQPKPEPCDIAYNPQLIVTSVGDSRSQETNTKSSRKDQKKEDELYNVTLLSDEQAVILSRERLISVSKVEKDALDDYLGTGNSQEHEEELMKYFENNNSHEQADPETKKLSQLRRLLEQNQSIAQMQHPQQPQIKREVIKPTSGRKMDMSFNLQTSGSAARRRVSFDTHVHEEPVPPSPNTRRKNFSFTPISPGPHSPKCSSTNASPFVSPRNTPVPRTRINSQTYAAINTATRKQIKNLKLKPEIGLGLDTNYKPQVAMSAPPSPKAKLLQDLLNNKVTYPSEYAAQSQMQSTGISAEVSQLLSNNIHNEVPPVETYRSQSVPLRINPNTYITSFNFDSNATQQNEFNDIDSFSASDNINKIINAIDNTSLNIIENNEMEFVNTLNEPEDFNTDFSKPSLRWGNRSQSFDYDDTNNVAKCPPYRSVPSTPIPYIKPKIELEKIYAQNSHSRSHPSTPLTNETTFNYNPSHDYLLNGQPIKEKQPSTVDVNNINYLQTENKDLIYSEIFNDTNITSDGLITDNKTNFNFDGQMGDNFGSKSINLEENCDIIGSDYFKGVSDLNRS